MHRGWEQPFFCPEALLAAWNAAIWGQADSLGTGEQKGGTNLYHREGQQAPNAELPLLYVTVL